jgi:AcrR family transcriptional regulator
MSTPNDDQGVRTGRRPGTTGTREAILGSARRRFAQDGYARATLRAIAAEAGVDQKLIAHFFGSKQQLFLAAVGLPLDPGEVLPGVLAGGEPDVVTERLATLLTSILEQPNLIQPIAAVLRASTTEPELTQLLRDFFPGALIEPLSDYLGPGDPALRLNLFGSQIVGLVMLRVVLEVEPIVSAPARSVAAAVAPTLTRYLIGPLGS